MMSYVLLPKIDSLEDLNTVYPWILNDDLKSICPQSCEHENEMFIEFRKGEKNKNFNIFYMSIKQNKIK